MLGVTMPQFDGPESWRDGLTEHWAVWVDVGPKEVRVLYAGPCEADARGLAEWHEQRTGQAPRMRRSPVP